MKRMIVAAAIVGLAGGATPGMAASLLVDPSMAMMSETSFDWTGPYAGARLGWSGGTETDDLAPEEFVISLSDNTADTIDLDGWRGGLYVGHNWQMDNLVFGIEASLDAGGASGDDGFLYTDAALAGTLSFDSNWQGAIRGRVGVVMDRALLYATAGLVGADATLTATVAGTPGGTFSDDNFHTGGTVGLGIEYALTDNLVGRAALDYAAFGDETYDLGGPFLPTEASWTQTTISLGLSYRF